MSRTWIGLTLLGVASAVAGFAMGYVGSLPPARDAVIDFRPPADGRRPNVLIVVWDTVRADHTSVHGYTKPTTPHLEALARDAAIYDHAISAGEWTAPSHASLFTGLPVSSHGVGNQHLWLDEHFLTMAEHFRANGYRTLAWSSNPFLASHTNLLQGFETVKFALDPDVRPACSAATEAKLIPNDRSSEISPAWEPPPGFGGWTRMAPKDAAPVAADEVLEFVDAAGDQPFLVFVNLLEAHIPRVPALESRIALEDPQMVARELEVDATLFRIMSANEGKVEIPPADREAIVAIYDAAIRDVDVGTAKLVEGLRARGELDDTIVIVTSDHGENLGEHGMWEHRWDLHDSVVHVPLVVRYPPTVPAKRIDDPVSNGHVFGTLLALTGVPAPAGVHLPVLGAEERVYAELAQPGQREASVKRAYKKLDPNRWNRTWEAVYEGDLKLLRASDRTIQLFDTTVDPGELTDLSRTRAADAKELVSSLDAWAKARPPYDPGARTPDDHPRPPAPDLGLAEQLKALGYATEDEDPPTEPETP